MDIIFNQEKFIDAYKDGEPLLRKHFLELDIRGEFNPDTEKYMKLEEKGLLKVYTARIENELVGYCAMVIYSDAQTGIFAAKQEVLYIKPDQRRSGLGLTLLSYIEKHLKENNIKELLQCVPVEMDWSALLIQDGYKKMETIYIKEI